MHCALRRPRGQTGAEAGAKQQGRVCLIVLCRELVRVLLDTLHVVHADLELRVDAEEPHESLWPQVSGAWCVVRGAWCVVRGAW